MIYGKINIERLKKYCFIKVFLNISFSVFFLIEELEDISAFTNGSSLRTSSPGALSLHFYISLHKLRERHEVCLQMSCLSEREKLIYNCLKRLLLHLHLLYIKFLGKFYCSMPPPPWEGVKI